MNGDATRHFVSRLTVIAVIAVLLALVGTSARGEPGGEQSSGKMSGRLLLTGSSTMAHDFVPYMFCRNLTEANGGKIEVESRPGEGTTFSLMLPAEGGEA